MNMKNKKAKNKVNFWDVMFLTKLVSSFRRNVALKCLPTTNIQRSKDVELNAAFCCLFFTFFLLCQRFPDPPYNHGSACELWDPNYPQRKKKCSRCMWHRKVRKKRSRGGKDHWRHRLTRGEMADYPSP